MTNASGGEPGDLRIVRTFDAPAQVVFDAWTDVDVLRRWWHAEPDWETPVARLDLRVGGEIYVAMRNPGDGSVYGGGGRYTLIDPPRRLAFTWTWDAEPSSHQLVEVEFVDHGDRTTVVLTNSGVPPDQLADHDEGWRNSFDNLDRALRA